MLHGEVHVARLLLLLMAEEVLVLRRCTQIFTVLTAHEFLLLLFGMHLGAHRHFKVLLRGD